jgi:hypothetical protein
MSGKVDQCNSSQLGLRGLTDGSVDMENAPQITHKKMYQIARSWGKWFFLPQLVSSSWLMVPFMHHDEFIHLRWLNTCAALPLSPWHLVNMGESIARPAIIWITKVNYV